MVWKGIIHPVECWKCLLNSRSGDDGFLKGLIAEKYKTLALESRTVSFVESYSEFLRYLGRDPIAKERKALNKAVLELVNKEVIEGMELRELMMLMASANAVDWGLVNYSYSLDDILAGWRNTRILDFPYAEMSRITLILDNAGEAVIDLLSARRMEELGFDVVIIARSLPYETDITRDEAEALARKLGVNAPIIGTGSRYPATFFPEMPDNIKGVIETSDIVLSKGIANLEAATESIPLRIEDKFFHLLRAKCRPMEELFSVENATPIIVGLRRARLYLDDYVRNYWQDKGI